MSSRSSPDGTTKIPTGTPEYAAPARTGDFTAASPARIGPDVASVDAERCTAPARYRWPALGCGLEELDERRAQSLIGRLL